VGSIPLLTQPLLKDEDTLYVSLFREGEKEIVKEILKCSLVNCEDIFKDGF